MRSFNTAYHGKYTEQVAFPLGGIGAGMFCIKGNGMLGSFSIKNAPDVLNEPNVFAALCVQGKGAKVLEGPIPGFKIFSGASDIPAGTANGLQGKNYGLKRFAQNSFMARFPYAELALEDENFPVTARIKAHSPFIPLDEDNSSLPVAAIEYTMHNPTGEKLDLVFSFNAFNFLKLKHNDPAFVRRSEQGFVLAHPKTKEEPWQEAYFGVSTTENHCVNRAWFRGGWFDTQTMLWNGIENGLHLEAAHSGTGDVPGASLTVAFALEAGESKTIPLQFCWYVPNSNLRTGDVSMHDTEGDNGQKCDCEGGCAPPPATEYYTPWYAGRFASFEELCSYYSENYHHLAAQTEKFTEALYRSTLPPEIMEAVTANLCILKSPTILRQTDGRIWGWEGCCNQGGCCPGNCSHVWNYAQAICHLFPNLERGLREVEFNENHGVGGHQQFRASIPIRPTDHDYPAAADGQLGSIMRVHREWRISGDDGWLATMFPKVIQSMEYCIGVWDKKLEGAIKEPHHNTYDIEFWGADGMCTSVYAGALQAVCVMAAYLGREHSRYSTLLQKSKNYMAEHLFNGEYFAQQVEYTTLEAGLSLEGYTPEAGKIIRQEGPKYQYGSGCLSDGIIGAWLAKTCMLEDIFKPEQITSHLQSVYRYNFKPSLHEHANPQRPGFALGAEAGLLLCTWPKGGKPSLPFVYSDEVWTGIEYQVASHMIHCGMLQEGLEIVRGCRKRYDGTVRNPFDEYECGHWYARAMASYALIESVTGTWYDNSTEKLWVQPKIPGDFTSFLCTQTGYGNVGVKNGKPFVEVVAGAIEVKELHYTAYM